MRAPGNVEIALAELAQRNSKISAEEAMAYREAADRTPEGSRYINLSVRYQAKAAVWAAEARRFLNLEG